MIDFGRFVKDILLEHFDYNHANMHTVFYDHYGDNKSFRIEYKDLELQQIKAQKLFESLGITNTIKID